MTKSVNPDIFRGNIITSRIRLARNIKGYPFHIEDPAVSDEVVKKVTRALLRADTFNLYYIKNLNPVKLEAMKERHLISNNLMENYDCGAVLVNGDESVSVMINEEDHIREQCFKRGFLLKEAYYQLNKVDDLLSRNLDLAYSERLGYLTACPTNVGTGMRASVLMFLPGLTESGKIDQLYEQVKRLGLTIRGLYGEGSKAEGYMYQISNEVTLGVTEEQIITTVEETVQEICEAERDYMEKLFLKDEISTMDRARKSYGVLTNAVTLTYSEFLSHIAQVKLGAMLGMINIENIEEIDELIMRVRPANLSEMSGKRLKPLNRHLYRAEVAGKILSKLKE